MLKGLALKLERQRSSVKGYEGLNRKAETVVSMAESREK